MQKSHAMSYDNVLSVEDYAEDIENTGLIIWNYYTIDGVQEYKMHLL